jgi:hypothetical protein
MRETSWTQAAVLDGYSILSTPRDDVRVGAQWQQGIGQDGPGAPLTDLSVTSSYSTLRTDTGLGAQVAANIYNLLNLSARARSRTAMVLNDVQVVTVSNISNLSIRPGSDVLYEAVRVGSFSISTADQFIAEVETAAIQEFGNSRVSFSADGLGRMTIDAKNVFVAYRVITLGEPSVSRKVKKLKSVMPVTINDYAITVRPDQAIWCACPISSDGRSVVGKGPTQGQLNQCESRNPLSVSVENFSLGLPGSGGLKKTFPYNWRSLDQGAVTLDTRIKNAAIEVDKLRIDAVLSTLVTLDCLVVGEEVFNEDVSSVEVVFIKYPFSPRPNPSAVGW